MEWAKIVQGQKGEGLILKVPTGTQIFGEDKETLLLDLKETEQRVILLEGAEIGGNWPIVKSGLPSQDKPSRKPVSSLLRANEAKISPQILPPLSCL